jgi:Ino eighty subunit 1
MEDSVASPPIASDIVSEPSSPADESRFNDESRFKWEDSRESSLEPLDGDDTQKFTQHADKPVRGKSRASQGKDPNAQQIGKIKHLKKEDGEPLWRKDIQHDFLRAIFDNDQKVFTNSYEPQDIGKQCFADLYIDTMSRSTKTSKVLRDKLLSDREAAKGMAMVCLLVNMGRMNTTLNCKHRSRPIRNLPSSPA